MSHFDYFLQNIDICKFEYLYVRSVFVMAVHEGRKGQCMRVVYVMAVHEGSL